MRATAAAPGPAGFSPSPRQHFVNGAPNWQLWLTTEGVCDIV